MTDTAKPEQATVVAIGSDVEQSDEYINTVPHQVGRVLVGSLAAYVADKAAGKAYDTAVRAIRARRSK